MTALRDEIRCLVKRSYRNQIIATLHLQPFELCLGVKLTETLSHPRPNAWNCIFFAQDKRYRQIMRVSMGAGIRVICAEIFEFLFQTRFVRQGHVEKLPGPETHLPLLD